MPPIAKAIGLLLLVADPVRGIAQTAGREQAFRRPSGVIPAAFQEPMPPEDQAGTPAAVPLSPPGRQTPLPLAPPGAPKRDDSNRAGGLPSLVTVIGSLAVVLGIFFLVAWCMRRAAPPGLTALPPEAFEVLGRAPMANRQQAYLLRCGNKLLLVSVTGAGVETLTEIVDPVEVDRLAGLCRQAQPNSATATFRQVFEQFAPRRAQWGSLWGLPQGGDTRDDLLAGSAVPATDDRLENRNV